MKCYLQILGVDSGDSSPTILLFFDEQSIIFNAGEVRPQVLLLKTFFNDLSYFQGIQRFFTEHKIRLRKVRRVFFTRLSAKTCGGLPGVILTLADLRTTASDSSTLALHGPRRLEPLLHATQHFMHPLRSIVIVVSFFKIPFFVQQKARWCIMPSDSS